MADGVLSVVVIFGGDKKYLTVIGPSVIMKYLVVIGATFTIGTNLETEQEKALVSSCA